MYAKESLKDTFIYVNRILKTELARALYYKKISNFIIQSFYFYYMIYDCMHTFAN